MENLKNRMYNYEVTPPQASWEIIASSLDNETVPVVSITKKKKRSLYYVLGAAASIAAIIFSITLWINNSSYNKIEHVASFMPFNKIPYRLANNYNLKKITSTEKNKKENSFLAGNIQSKTLKIEENKKSIYQDNNGNIALETKPKTYITIAGPEGQPVKISPKVATLIESSDDKYPPNAVWSSKINKWKDIMKANILIPTATNFLDIVELADTFREREN